MAKLEIATIAIQNLEGPSGNLSSVCDVDRFRCVAGFTRHQLRDQCVHALWCARLSHRGSLSRAAFFDFRTLR